MRRIFITGASSGIGLAAYDLLDKQVDSLRSIQPSSAALDSRTQPTAFSTP
jgi:NAD(P)-dependent dehydrogenase (short-subunit alcohol dehydrogenase family)